LAASFFPRLYNECDAIWMWKVVPPHTFIAKYSPAEIRLFALGYVQVHPAADKRVCFFFRDIPAA